ncbi:helix-turn-helix transcriptional regulator [Trichocoleus sp. FACHB-591]|uniref:helix-turn-helix transcriptional regulator n=1 Tax=Trichocoleus sp. FACHB-591 TaxID=2692872 RepID=UPI0016894A5F|nr:helix-turn-helix transcriptional regulator [Trichocoleus sp. FACHB-591]MBD2094558.1 helix-turn-helix transcriptional regulator [Trichocoleus sp. FACHB-591]
MNSLINAPERTDRSIQGLDRRLTSRLKPALLQEAIECFMDGILLLTPAGDWVHGNSYARQVCGQLTQNLTQPHRAPQQIWLVCEVLVKNHQRGSSALVVESEVTTPNFNTIRVRASWLKPENSESPFVLVTLEDRYQAMHNKAIAEVQQYRLTPREAEVWLLYQDNYSYKEIATKLYITVNTVKRHMKSIHAKRKGVLEIES